MWTLWKLLTVISVLGALVEASCISKDGACKRKMKREKLIPNYFNKVKTTKVKIQFSETTVDCGNTLGLVEALKAPKVSYKGGADCKNLTLLMFDPDAPLIFYPYLHWLVYSIPADVLAKSGYTSGGEGKEIQKYFPMSAATDDHRYTYCLYCQDEKTNTSKKPGRTKFFPKKFATEQHLGDPVACNFIYLQAVKFPTIAPFDKLHRDLMNTDKNPILKAGS